LIFFNKIASITAGTNITAILGKICFIDNTSPMYPPTIPAKEPILKLIPAEKP
jgi:hypothetical protein